jgi:hypothetical protein
VLAPPPRPRIELLGRDHDRARFICGREALDRYFQQQVTQDARRRIATPFVMVIPDGANGGFYTLSSTALRLQELPEDTARRQRNPPGASIAARRSSPTLSRAALRGEASYCSMRCIAARRPLRRRGRRRRDRRRGSGLLPACQLLAVCPIRLTDYSGG